jgi:two-component system cell cycle sensor histidine kinase/response regulator CckA
MSAAPSLPWSQPPLPAGAGTGFRSNFEQAPVPAVCCNSQGIVIETNPAFDQTFPRGALCSSSLRLHDLVALQDLEATESLFRDLLEGSRRSFRVEGRLADGGAVTHWTAWRVAASGDIPIQVLLMAEERGPETDPAMQDSLQAQRWEAVGRLAGGVVHDFNNLLTGVMLYCDLLLCSLVHRDRKLRSYADEIRSAIVQATGLVSQLLVFARPTNAEVRALCLNQVAEAMRDMLTRLIGENVALDLRLDPQLGMVKIDPAQAQQILLNLILNARDAMPKGGRIIVETTNCKLQTLTGSAPARLGATFFPCILLGVGDNGRGMDSHTRKRLFEPFFTTKSAGKGTGLGLTTIRAIVSACRGLIHVESQPGEGTRVMILLPRAGPSDRSAPSRSVFDSPPVLSQAIKKESPL